MSIKSKGNAGSVSSLKFLTIRLLKIPLRGDKAINELKQQRGEFIKYATGGAVKNTNHRESHDEEESIAKMIDKLIKKKIKLKK